jgi:tetratricopeptide (TPR) repeat protein
MSNARLEKLLEFIKEQPDDIFLKYALAMEYQGLNDIGKTKEYFEEVVKVDKNHVAAYYQLGKIFERLNDETSAISIYEKGMEAAKLKNDSRSMRELKTALDELLF